MQKIGETRAKYFSKLDLKSAYNQLVINEDSKKYTSFSCFRGQYSFNRMPFGVKTAPAIFQRMMSSLLSRNKWLNDHAIAFIDDILIFSESIQEQKELLKALFKLFREVNLFLHPVG